MRGKSMIINITLTVNIIIIIVVSKNELIGHFPGRRTRIGAVLWVRCNGRI